MLADSISCLATKGRMPSRGGGQYLMGTHAMQSVQPDNTDSMPLRQSPHGVGTIMIRFVGLLTLAVVAMTLLWGS
jgi:hypothetical protein